METRSNFFSDKFLAQSVLTVFSCRYSGLRRQPEDWTFLLAQDHEARLPEEEADPDRGGGGGGRDGAGAHLHLQAVQREELQEPVEMCCGVSRFLQTENSEQTNQDQAKFLPTWLAVPLQRADRVPDHNLHRAEEKSSV